MIRTAEAVVATTEQPSLTKPLKTCTRKTKSGVRQAHKWGGIKRWFLPTGVYWHSQQYFSYISWHSVLMVEETGIPGENHRLAASQ
jgi:hypothetical protein